jgi:hypothetical protein
MLIAGLCPRLSACAHSACVETDWHRSTRRPYGGDPIPARRSLDGRHPPLGGVGTRGVSGIGGTTTNVEFVDRFAGDGSSTHDVSSRPPGALAPRRDSSTLDTHKETRALPGRSREAGAARFPSRLSGEDHLARPVPYKETSSAASAGSCFGGVGLDSFTDRSNRMSPEGIRKELEP